MPRPPFGLSHRGEPGVLILDAMRLVNDDVPPVDLLPEGLLLGVREGEGADHGLLQGDLVMRSHLPCLTRSVPLLLYPSVSLCIPLYPSVSLCIPSVSLCIPLYPPSIASSPPPWYPPIARHGSDWGVNPTLRLSLTEMTISYEVMTTSNFPGLQLVTLRFSWRCQRRSYRSGYVGSAQIGSRW